jgi:multiple sugar transport system ATP-binding protein
MQLGQRIIVLREGRVQQIGEPRELYDRPANRFVGDFMASPRMNFFTARLVSRDEGLWLETAELAMRWPEQPEDLPPTGAEHPVILGVRPEHVEIRTAGTTVRSTTWRAEIRAVQMLGSEIWLDLQSTVHRFTARVAPGHHHRPGENVEVSIRPSWCHLFDPLDGRRLASCDKRRTEGGNA